MRKLDDPQLSFAETTASTYETHAAGIRKLLVRALRDNGVSQEQLAHLTGTDPSHLSRMLAGNGAHVALDVQAAIMALDAKRVVISGLSAMCGGEWRVKEADPAEENRRLRARVAAMREELDRMLEDA